MSTDLGPTATAVEGDSDEAEDGRRARRDRNRVAVVDSLLALYAEGDLNPSTDAIALRAGLSPRSLFRYFDDADDLSRAAIARQHGRIQPLLRVECSPEAALATRVKALVDQRTRLFEAMGNVGRVARLREPFQPLVAAELAETRAYLRKQIKRLMARELNAMTSRDAANALAAIDVLCSFEAFHLLRDDQGRTRASTAAVWTHAVVCLLKASVQIHVV